jgi:adenosylmethionine-8-amino-7-oxononanoate aminotransferase
MYHRDFGPLVPGVVHIGQPDPGDPNAADELERAIVEARPDSVAAFIAEPISLPSRVTIPSDDYWPAVRDICSRYDVLMISDEVITGFGRTGRMFAVEHWDVEPDLLVMSKGLSSGYVPIGAVGLSERVYETISSPEQPLLHGFTAGGHPVSCAVATANIELMQREDVVARGAEAGAYLAEQLEALVARQPRCTGVRALGMLAGLDLAPEGEPAQAGTRVREGLLERGVLLRQYTDTLVMGPPLVATREDIDEIVARIEDAVAA